MSQIEKLNLNINDDASNDYSEIIAQPNPPVFKPSGVDIRKDEAFRRLYALEYKKRHDEPMTEQEVAELKELYDASKEYRKFKDARTAYFEAHPDMLEKGTEGAWLRFVEESSNDGRNPHMVALFLRWLNSGMDEDEMVDEAYRRYCEEWPDNIDDDALEQLDRAAYKARDIYSGDAQFRGENHARKCRAVKQAEIDKAKAKHNPSEVLAAIEQIPEDKRLHYKDPNIKYNDESTETLARFMSDVLRAIHGQNAYVFLGKKWQSRHDDSSWYYIAQPAKTPSEDSLISNLTRMLYKAEQQNDWPEFFCNCNFQKPQAHGTRIVGDCEKPVGHRKAEFASRIVSFTVECDSFLSTGEKPETQEEKAASKDEQHRLIQWIHAELGLYPVMVVDSGNKSIQATYLLDTAGMEKEKAKNAYNYLGKLFSVLGADPAVFSVPHVYRAPQMYRWLNNEPIEVIQACLHFDPQAERYSLPDVVGRLERVLGIASQTEMGCVFDSNLALEELMENGVSVGFDSSLLETYVNDPKDYLGTHGHCSTNTLSGAIFNHYKQQGVKLARHEADTVADNLKDMYYKKRTLPIEMQRQMSRCWIAEEMRKYLDGVEPATDDIIEEWYDLIGVKKEDNHGRLTLYMTATNIVAAAFAGEAELNFKAYGQLCCPIVLGASGIGKTSYVLTLIPDEWALLDGSYNSGRAFDMYEAQKYLVAEYSEANEFFGKEGEALKRKLTSKHLEGRQLYERQRTEELRHTFFVMTSNSKELTFEDSGERRYGIVDLHHLTQELVVWRRGHIRALYDEFRQSGKGARILKRALLDVQQRGHSALAWDGEDAKYHDAVLASHTLLASDLQPIIDLFDWGAPICTDIVYRFSDLTSMAKIHSNSRILIRHLQDYLKRSFPEEQCVIKSGSNTFYRLPPLLKKSDGCNNGYYGDKYGIETHALETNSTQEATKLLGNNNQNKDGSQSL